MESSVSIEEHDSNSSNCAEGLYNHLYYTLPVRCELSTRIVMETGRNLYILIDL